ncbi:AP-3 complex subunit sigma-1-like [Oncorhynchus tshawytscha]|uniref:AP-3 complex subunit sigma-1-like n=1 Tax=Oncorhynchus tshawytscha TaxID=74940 RepID=UPI001C3CBFA2|nr:AP-3 complex subunit sigma-1-like [Oncorhynchus tshawytscha]
MEYLFFCYFCFLIHTDCLFFYVLQSEDTEQQIIRETFHLVSKRDENVCNFLEGGMLIGGSENKLIYRHYATLYFVFCVDSSESELGILDLIQVFVETLDKCFENVCELDLIFHVDKVENYFINYILLFHPSFLYSLYQGCKSTLPQTAALNAHNECLTSHRNSLL